MRSIALATCPSLPHWEIDDRFLHAALDARGIAYDRPAWSDGAVDWSRYDAVLIRTTWDYQQWRDDFVAWADRVGAVTALHNPAPVVRWNTHKGYLRDLEARGVPVVDTIWCRAGEVIDLCAALADRGWSRAFLKPAVGATARETLRFAATDRDLDAARAHLARLQAAGETMLLQPYLERVETDGERSAVFIDGALTHAVRKVPVPGDYRVQDDFGARDEPYEPTDGERTFAEAAVARAGFADLLYARVDWLRDGDGRPRLTELELVEPSLFFRHAPAAAGALAEALLRRLG